MSWQHWVLTVLLGLAIWGGWTRVDKPRKTVTAEDALGGTLVNLIAVMLLVWGQRA